MNSAVKLSALASCAALLLSALPSHADPRFGSLKLTSHPDSAIVILDGKDIGRTPLVAQAIVPGTYLLVVTKDGYRRWTKAITFEGGKRVVGKAKLDAMTQAEADSSQQLDSIRSAAYGNLVSTFVYGFYLNLSFDQAVAEMALSRVPELKKRVPPVYIPADAPVLAVCSVIIPMLVAENGSVIWASIVKSSGSLVLDDAAWEAARHCLFSPALDLDGYPVRTCVSGFFSSKTRRDSLKLVSLMVFDTTGKATAQDQTTAFDTAMGSGLAGMPFTRLFTKWEKEPVAVRKVEPVYPDETKAFGIEGKVTVMMEIDAGGRVTNAEVMKSAYNDLLNQAAVDAAKQWVFKPALARGKNPVRSWFTHEFTFKLKK